MRSLYLVTHPEASHAIDRLVGGWYDADLTSRGLAHAGRIADSIATRLPPHDSAVFTSDLRRARRTAQGIADRFGVDPVPDAGLREQTYGAADGQPVGTVAAAPRPTGGDRLRHHDGVDGSETRLDVAGRVYAALGRVLDHGAEHSVVVTHGGAATFVITGWIGMPLESLGSVRFTLSPGSISVLRQEGVAGDRQVLSLNEVDHLRGGGQVVRGARGADRPVE